MVTGIIRALLENPDRIDKYPSGAETHLRPAPDARKIQVGNIGKVLVWEILDNYQSGDRSFQLTLDSEEVGFVYLTSAKSLVDFVPSSDMLGIYNVYIEPKYRAQGLGYALYRMVIDQGIKLVAATTLTPDSMSIWRRLVDDPKVLTYALDNSTGQHYDLDNNNDDIPSPDAEGLTFRDVVYVASSR